MIGRAPGRLSRPVGRLVMLGLLALLLVPATGDAALDATPRSATRVRAAAAPRPECIRGRGVPRRECPKVRSRPRLVSMPAGAALSPVLVGSTYAVSGGRWAALRPLRLSIEWLDGHGRRLSRSVSLALTPALVGNVVTARICARTRLAASCLALRLPGPIRTVAQYLQASCGTRRPTPPPYDPNFVLLSAPQVAHGWNPCKVDVWAIDTYGEPPLLDPAGASWESLISQALAQASAATGIAFERSLDFVAPPGQGTGPPAGVTLAVGFGPQAAGIAGTGGPIVSASPFAAAGEVELDSQKSWTAHEAMTVLLHEIGHALGLGHPLPPPAPALENEIMDSGNYRFTSYQPGDLCGLFEVTWQLPCAGAAVATPGQGTEAAPSPGSG